MSNQEQSDVQRGREVVAEAAKTLPAIVLEADADTVTCRIPRDVLRYFLVLHQAGLSDDEHFALANDAELLARTFAVALELSKNTS